MPRSIAECNAVPQHHGCWVSPVPCFSLHLRLAVVEVARDVNRYDCLRLRLMNGSFWLLELSSETEMLMWLKVLQAAVRLAGVRMHL